MNHAESGASNPPFTVKLDNIDPAHSAVSKLGIGVATAKDLGIGYYGGPGVMAGRIVIPVRNATGTLVAYAGLEPRAQRSRTCLFLPSTFDPSLELYNLDHALSLLKKSVIVVQDLQDCVKSYEYGIQETVALMGNRLSETQEVALVCNFAQIILMFRGDDEGWSITQEAVRRLATQSFVRAVVLPARQSAADLSKQDFYAALQG